MMPCPTTRFLLRCESMPITDLRGIWPDTVSILQRQGITTIHQLLCLQDTDILRMPGITWTALQNIFATLTNYGLFIRPKTSCLPTPPLPIRTHPISELYALLPINVQKALKRTNIQTIEQLSAMTFSELKGISGIKHFYANRIKAILNFGGWHLADETVPGRRFFYYDADQIVRKGTIVEQTEANVLLCHLDAKNCNEIWPIDPADIGTIYHLLKAGDKEDAPVPPVNGMRSYPVGLTRGQPILWLNIPDRARCSLRRGNIGLRPLYIWRELEDLTYDEIRAYPFVGKTSADKLIAILADHNMYLRDDPRNSRANKPKTA